MTLACLLAAGGCASTVGLQKDGSWGLDKSEQAMDCQRLNNSLWGRVQLVKQMPAKAQAEKQQAAPTAMLAWGRMFGGSNKGLVAVKEYDSERAHVRALHKTAIAKGCPPLDVEQELATTDAAMAVLRK